MRGGGSAARAIAAVGPLAARLFQSKVEDH